MVCHLFVIAPARNYCSKVVLVTHGERGIQDGSVLGAVLGAYDSTQPLMRLRNTGSEPGPQTSCPY